MRAPSDAVGLAAGKAAWASLARGTITLRHRAIFDRNPDLVAALHAFVRTELSDLSTLWLSGRSVFRLDLERTAGGAELLVAPAQLPHGLTPREIDVLTLLSGGLDNRTIADRLGTSRSTVATQVERILDKLGQPTRTAAAAVAIENGILRFPIPGGPTGLESIRIGQLQLALDGESSGGADRQPLPRRPRRFRLRPLLFGTLVPSNEDDRAEGVDMRRGAALAIEEINARSGIGGRSVEHAVVEFDARSASSAVDALRTLCEADVDAVTFAYTHERAAIPSLLAAMSELAVPVLHSLTSQTSVDLVHAAPTQFGNIFQICPSDDLYGRCFAGFLAHIRDRRLWTPASARVALVCADDPALGALLPGWVDVLGQFGFDITLIRVESTVRSWRSAADRLRDLDVSAALLGCFIEAHLSEFLSRFLADPSPTLLYAIWAPGRRDFRRRAAVDGLIWSTVIGAYADSLGRRFETTFAGRFGGPPGRASASIHYDAVGLLARAWQAADPMRTPEVVAALRNLIHRGVNGAYEFGPSRQCPLSFPLQSVDPSTSLAHLTFQIQDGEQRIIAPEVYASERLRRPWWLPAELLPGGAGATGPSVLSR